MGRLLPVVALLVHAASCRSDPELPAPQANLLAALTEGVVTTRYTDPVFGFRVDVPAEFIPRLAFENPGSTDEVIKQRIVFRGTTRADIVIDVWENPRELGLDDWLTVFGRWALYSDAVIQQRGKAGRPGLDAVFGRTPGAQSPPLRLVILHAGKRVYRLLYADGDAGASTAAFEGMVRSFEP